MLKASRPAPLDPTRIAAVRRPFDEADMFPPSVYHDPAIFDWEAQEIFTHEWRCVGREEETPRVRW